MDDDAVPWLLLFRPTLTSVSPLGIISTSNPMQDTISTNHVRIINHRRTFHASQYRHLLSRK
jgi:hypothetical protein